MELFKRVISAITMIAILTVCVFAGKIPLTILYCAVCVFMMLDVTNVLNHGGFKPQSLVLILTTLCVFPAVFLKGITGYFILSAISFSVIAICVIFSKEPDFKSLLSSGFSLIYPLMPGTLLVFLVASDLNRTETLGIGTILSVSAILCAAGADTFAYFGGKFFGKRKLCPQISPKKTVVGGISSFFGGAVGGVVMYFVFRSFTDAIQFYDWLVIGFVCGGFAQIGDLTASMLKRFCDVKDYGHYIPGHGGVMDRMDSISACLIAIVLYVQIFVPEIL